MHLWATRSFYVVQWVFDATSALPLSSSRGRDFEPNILGYMLRGIRLVCNLITKKNTKRLRRAKKRQRTRTLRMAMGGKKGKKRQEHHQNRAPSVYRFRFDRLHRKNIGSSTINLKSCAIFFLTRSAVEVIGKSGRAAKNNKTDAA